MSRRAIVETPESGRVEIDYSVFSEAELSRRIDEYERKYGAPFAEYSKSFSCDAANAYEMLDIMDWETLVAERDDRASCGPRVKGQ